MRTRSLHRLPRPVVLAIAALLVALLTGLPSKPATADDAGLTVPKILTFTCLSTANCDLDGIATVTENDTPSVRITYTFVGTHGTFSTTTSPAFFGPILNLNGLDVWEMSDILFSLGTPPDAIRCAEIVTAVAVGAGGVDVAVTPHPPDVNYCLL